MRDEDHRPTVGGHLAHVGKQPLGLLRRQNGGRLVEDQDARVAVERLQDLDPLLLAERELPDAGARIDLDPVALADLPDPRLDRARVDPERAAAGRAVLAERDVLRDRERLDEAEVLVHHPDSRVERVPWRAEPDRPAVEEDLAPRPAGTAR